jgi:hypothetical protein
MSSRSIEFQSFEGPLAKQDLLDFIKNFKTLAANPFYHDKSFNIHWTCEHAASGANHCWFNNLLNRVARAINGVGKSYDDNTFSAYHATASYDDSDNTYALEIEPRTATYEGADDALDVITDDKIIPADYRARIDRLKKALADGRIKSEPETAKGSAGSFDLAGLLRAIERGTSSWSILGSLDAPSPKPADDDDDDDEWMEIYSQHAQFKEFCGKHEHLKPYHGFRYFQCWGGGPEGGYIMNDKDETYKVNRGWGEPFKVERVDGIIDMGGDERRLRIIAKP